MSIEESRTLRVLGPEELEAVAGGTDATIMPVMPPVYPKPDVPPPHLPRYPEVPPPNDIEGPIIRF